jgi:mannose-6-phosphate isomerase-like protein (cupin superfamily)
MREVLFSALGLSVLLSISGQSVAQTKVEQLPDGVVNYIKASEVADASKPPQPGVKSTDVTMLRVLGVNKGEYAVGIAVLNRPKTPAGQDGGGLEEHTDITEVYQILSGHATFVSGGTLTNMKPETPINTKIGPGFHGDTIQGGVTREIGPGDMVIIPPMTPHWWKQITSDQLVYTVVRIDPHHVLSMPPAK